MKRGGPGRIAAVGAGRMGRGIAHVFAYAGYEVDLIDLKVRDGAAARQLERQASDEVAANLQILQEAGVIAPGRGPEILRRISLVPRAEAEAALGRAEVIFEGVPEVLDAKREAFAFISRAARADAVIASTTSTFLVDTLAAFVDRPERFLNAHWLNPAYIIPLVELSPGQATDSDVLQRMKALLEAVGKVPVVCAASPGYIVPRIQALAMNEAARMVEEGVATAEDIDKATRFGFGFRFAILGLIEFIDWGGGDILYYASRYLADAMQDRRFAAPEVVNRNMEAGHVGMRSGRGFYDFDAIDIAAYQKDRLTALIRLLKHFDLVHPPAGGPATAVRQTNEQEGKGRASP